MVKTALAAAHGKALPRERVSGYYLAGEIAATYNGMLIAVPARQWKCFGRLTSHEMAQVLLCLAHNVRPDRFLKNIRGPKKPRPKRISGAETTTSLRREYSQKEHPQKNMH